MKEFSPGMEDIRMLQDKFCGVEMSVEEARQLAEMTDMTADLLDCLICAIDEAQGEVFSGKATKAYVLIRIVP